jgi:dCMP deaminase
MKDHMKYFYMTIAEQYSLLSKDPRTKVGSVIVTQEGILYPGINGWAIGEPEVPDSLEPGCSGTIHAEAAAIIKFNPTIHKGSSIFITHVPCRVCSRMIINTQAISRVYYKNEYRDMFGIDILEKAGIFVERVD